VHERNVNIDVNLALLKQLLGKRPDLKLVITSATLDSSKLKKFFSAKTLNIKGRTYPVVDRQLHQEPGFLLLADVVSHTTSRAKINRDKKGKEKIKEPEDEDARVTLGSGDSETVVQLLSKDKHCARMAVSACATLLAKKEKGDILVFLPGQEDVWRAVTAMEAVLVQEFPSERVRCLPLFGALNPQEQERVHKSNDELNCDRKIIFATNIAETSVTIKGIKFVVDSGREKVMSLDPRTGWPSLQLQPVTKSSVTQRRGRAGRTEEGYYIPLYTISYASGMQDNLEPEMRRCDLTSTLLEVLCLEGKWLPNMQMIDPPSEVAVRYAIETLTFLDAINMTGATPTVTEKGRLMARLRFSSPHTAAMLLRAAKPDLGVSEEVAIIAVMMEVGPLDRFSKKYHERLNDMLCSQLDESGDHITLLHLFLQYRKEKPYAKERWCKHLGIDPRKMQAVEKLFSRTMKAMQKNNIPILSCPKSVKYVPLLPHPPPPTNNHLYLFC